VTYEHHETLLNKLQPQQPLPQLINGKKLIMLKFFFNVGAQTIQSLIGQMSFPKLPTESISS
jgi:hypothetical protein